MSSSENTILVRGNRGAKREAPAGEAGIYPGMGLSFQTDGDVVKQAAAVGEAIKSAEIIAVEDMIQGATVTTVYTAAMPVFYYVPQPGDIINILVKDGETIAIGDKLVPEGGGTGLYVEAAGTEARYPWIAMEAVSPSGANGLIKCMKT